MQQVGYYRVGNTVTCRAKQQCGICCAHVKNCSIHFNYGFHRVWRFLLPSLFFFFFFEGQMLNIHYSSGPTTNLGWAVLYGQTSSGIQETQGEVGSILILVPIFVTTFPIFVPIIPTTLIDTCNSRTCTAQWNLAVFLMVMLWDYTENFIQISQVTKVWVYKGKKKRKRKNKADVTMLLWINLLLLQTQIIPAIIFTHPWGTVYSTFTSTRNDIFVFTIGWMHTTWKNHGHSTT